MVNTIIKERNFLGIVMFTSSI